MMVEEFIGKIISYRQNDFLIIKSYTEENDIEWNYEEIEAAFEELQTAFTRWLINHNYCTNKGCKCSPRSVIKFLIKENDKVYKRELYPDDYEWLKEWGE